MLVENARRIQVGIGSVELGPTSTLIDAVGPVTAGADEQVRAVIDQGDSGHCTVSSADGEGALDQPVPETLANDGQVTSWTRSSDGRMWQTAATGGDVLTITCDNPEGARPLAMSASFS